MIGFLPRGSYNSISINPSVFPCLIKSLIYKGMEGGGEGREKGSKERGRRNKEGQGEERGRVGRDKKREGEEK